MKNLNALRINYQPKLPKILNDLSRVKHEKVENSASENNHLKNYFPKTFSQPRLDFVFASATQFEPMRIGVLFSGGPAAGGHNVITGIFDAIKKMHPNSSLYGFHNGPSGLISNNHILLTDEFLASYRNQGGFDMIGTGRTKIETNEQFEKAAKTVQQLKLDGLVIIGGDDSNTNAAHLAEYYVENGISTRVVGVPKTIDGDLKNNDIEISFGFDTATKIFSETIGNILRDCLSQKKYYFFIKIMGRSASHIALECALQTHPNMTFIGEEIVKNKWTLQELTVKISDMICERAEADKNYGVILIPEGIIEFIPEFNALISELNGLNCDPKWEAVEKINFVRGGLSDHSRQCFDSIPREIQVQLLLDKDPHGNIQVSKIEIERLLISTVSQELKKRKSSGMYKGSFSPQPLFCGYEGRSCYPSNFDAQYCYALGHVAALLITGGVTGYLSCVQNLTQPVEEWTVTGIPLISMMHLEERKGKFKPVIKKALVDLEKRPFKIFQEQRNCWMLQDDYLYPGPMQFYEAEISERISLTLRYEKK